MCVIDMIGTLNEVTSFLTALHRSLNFVHNTDAVINDNHTPRNDDNGTGNILNGPFDGISMNEGLNNSRIGKSCVEFDVSGGPWQFSTQQQASQCLSEDDEDDDEEQDKANRAGKRKRGGRKIHFSDVEALAIAQAWVSQSERSASQRGSLFWDGVNTRLEKELGVKRGVESIRSLWKRMNRDCQLYISIKSQVEERGATSGKNEQQIEQMVSDLFTSRSGKLNSDGIRVAGPPFRFRKVAEYLVQQPKWKRRSCRSVKPSRDPNVKAGDSTKVPAAVLGGPIQGDDDGDRDGDCRPKGIKSRKLEDKNVTEKKKMRREMKNLNSLIAKSNSIAETTAQRDRRVFLLGIMPENTPNYSKYMEEVIAEEFSTVHGSRGSEKNRTDMENECSLKDLSSDSE